MREGCARKNLRGEMAYLPPDDGGTGEWVLERVPDELPELVALVVLRALPRLALATRSADLEPDTAQQEQEQRLLMLQIPATIKPVLLGLDEPRSFPLLYFTLWSLDSAA